MDKIELTQSDELYLLGDYVDRGPDSKGVIDTVFELRAHQHKVVCLKGNHEEYMIRSRQDEQTFLSWLGWGGLETIQSFGVRSVTAIPERYWIFLDGLSLYHETNGYLLVHAGFNFHIENPFTDRDSMLWIRNWHPDIDYEWLGQRIIVHGHSPRPTRYIMEDLEMLDDQRVIDIDNGCFARHLEGHGKLCAIDLTNRECHFELNVDDMSAYLSRRQ